MTVSAELARLVGPANVLTTADMVASYVTDWTRRYVGTTACVVRPGNVDEVAAALAWCNERGIGVVPQGGNTGLVAGGVPLEGEVVFSLSRLAGLGDVEHTAGQVTAGAGVRLAALQDHVARSGWVFGVDLAARGSCTIGGMVATNAGGVHVVRHGPMRAQVLGLEAVLADGSTMTRLSGLLKDNTGYDLPGLIVGSEGTLAVVTAARLRLVADPPERACVLVATGSVGEALELAALARRTVPGVEAIEFVHVSALDVVERELGLKVPFDRRVCALVLVEVADFDDPLARLEQLVSDRDAVVARDSPARARLWEYRERVTEAVSLAGIPHKLDVTLPLQRLAQFVDEILEVVPAASAGAVPVLFGHAGDGNVHVNVLGVAPDDERVDDAVLRTVAAYEGSISAEHGIGRAKRRWIHLTRSASELAAMRAVKQAFDPNGILNPGVLFP